jgi:hypothetical protein
VLNDMPYEALSYCWGHQQESDRSQIELWDETSWNALSVTANLIAALGRLRHTDGERCLWIDANCIDQSNNAGKSQQIRLMGRIYLGASMVLVGLGESEAKDELAFELKKEISKIDQEESRLFGRIYTEHWTPPLEIMTRDWFSRRWIIREAAHARNIEVHCGSYARL